MMAALLSVLALLVHAALVACAAPVLEDIVRQAGARWHGLPVPPRGQAVRDLVRLWRKPGLAPSRSWFLFAMAPAVALGAAAAAALTVPSFTLAMSTAGPADLLVVIALLALSRLAPLLAAFDTGAPAAAHAALRTGFARLPAEPLLLLVALFATLQMGTTHLDANPVRDGLMTIRLPGVLAGFAFVAWAATEPAAPAVFSGRDLALVTVAAQLRRVVALSLAALVGLPFGVAQAGAAWDAWVVGLCLWALKVGGLAVLGTWLAPQRGLLPAAALLALLAAVIVGVQGRA